MTKLYLLIPKISGVKVARCLLPKISGVQVTLPITSVESSVQFWCKIRQIWHICKPWYPNVNVNVNCICCEKDKDKTVFVNTENFWSQSGSMFVTENFWSPSDSPHYLCGVICTILV